MDIKAYIESGIIESYALGLASAEEAAELELLSVQYPDIKKTLDDFEMVIAKRALQDAIEPPREVKEILLNTLSTEFETAVVLPISSNDFPQALQPQIKIHRTVKILRFMAAASIILLITSTGLNFYLYSNYQSTNDKYQELLTEHSTLQAKNDAFQTKFNSLQQSILILQNPDMYVVKMKGVPGKENELATVYWNIKTKDVYLYANNLTQTPADKQYQLWAIVDGKPIDAGLMGNCEGVCKMKNIPKAQAFAITLENKGGSSAPTLSSMFVLGKV